MIKKIHLKNRKNKNYMYGLNNQKGYFSCFDRELFFKQRKVIAEQLNTKLTIYI